MDQNRINHSLSVAKKMVEIGKEYNLNNEELNDLFLLGLNHDIGYEFGLSKNHNKNGSDVLKRNGFKYYREVLYHGLIQDEYDSLFLKILNQADMQIDGKGNDLGYDGRLMDIEERYGKESSVYKTVCELVEKIR